MLRNVVLASLVVLAAQTGWAETPKRTITVTGEGRVEAEPDMATLNIGVLTEARSADAAIDANSAAMTAVLERLAGAGIADRDLMTSDFSVSPRWNRQTSSGDPRIDGFIVQNRLQARVRDLATLGAVLDAVAEDGANSFGGLTFGLQTPGPVEDAARWAAVADARSRAELYAEAAGVTLGPLLRLDETVNIGGPVPMMRAEMSMAADAVPIATGELTLSARVTLQYEIVD